MDQIKRCAVYTRKSSEEGLDQEFNSLDAQREAGEAYVKSQRHEGWELLDNRYDDGGISGGTMERPGLKQLLNDVEAGLIDIIVVYKVDRLSRSLGDFSKMVDLFDRNNVSFVSVTQQFNTTTSMGRLTLNILLSFSQFEREVTSERIRDKIALSKQRGMWMGGNVPLGFDAIDRKLVVNLTEAATISHIFEQFLALGSTTLLSKALREQGYRTKPRRDASGHMNNGNVLTKTALYKILSNRIYLGEVRHKEKWYPGQHEAIIDIELWERVHAILATNKVQRGANVRRQTPAPLKGLLFGPDGLAMTPTHTKKGNKKYRYYVTHTANKHSHDQCMMRMVPAGEIEGIVFDQLKIMFKNSAFTANISAQQIDGNLTTNDIRQGLQNIESLWDHLYHKEQARLLQLFVTKIQITADGVRIDIQTNGIHSLIMDLKKAAYDTQQNQNNQNNQKPEAICA